MEIPPKEEENEQQTHSEYCDALLSETIIAITHDEYKNTALKKKLGESEVQKTFEQKGAENSLDDAVGPKNPVQSSERDRIASVKKTRENNARKEKMINKNYKAVDEIMKRYTKDLKIQREKELKLKKQMAKSERKEKRKLEKEMKKKEKIMMKNLKVFDIEKKDKQDHAKVGENEKENKNTVGLRIYNFFRNLSCLTGQRKDV
ncbi:DNA ligase 1-like [Mytilus trossulus]|uniref:DNA ligase 1-like n=1 Tax=Mytilus trossulus TaxID=6551 RepID=UPI003005F014